MINGDYSKGFFKTDVYDDTSADDVGGANNAAGVNGTTGVSADDLELIYSTTGQALRYYAYGEGELPDPKPALEEARQLSEQLNSMLKDTGSRGSVLADFMALLMLFLQYAANDREMRKETADKAMMRSLEVALTAMNNSINAAQEAFKGSVVAAVMQVAAGVAMVVGGVYGGAKGIKGASTQQQSTNADLLSKQTKDLNLKYGLKTQSADLAKEAGVLTAKGQASTTAAQGVGQATQGLGGMVNASYEKESETMKAHGQMIQSGKDVIDKSQDYYSRAEQDLAGLIRDFLEKINAMLSQDAQTNSGIARNI